MKKKLILHPSAFILATAALALPAALFAQPVVSNVTFAQQPDGAGSTEVVVTYDLAHPTPCFVGLKFSANNGASFVINPAAVEGDFGYPVVAGTGKQMIWQIGEDLSGWNLSGVVARVVARELRPNMILTITNSAGDGAVTANAGQTFTFSFDEPVTDFDISDVTVSGGTGTLFTKVNDSVYTLEVVEIGGTVTASVPDLAAYSTTGNANAAASSSYFYQDTWTITLPGAVPMELIRIPAGTFTMGSPVDELSRDSGEIQRIITLTQDFYLGKTEVTQAQWLAVYGSFPDGGQSHGTGAGSETRAVHRVSDQDILDPFTGFMRLLNQHILNTNQGPATATLPTEAQWEYACRAGTTTRFNFGDGFAGDEISDTGGGRGPNMWFGGNASGTQLVGQKPANPWGLYDMHGNVREWCKDWLAPYDPTTLVDPEGPTLAQPQRVVRGGAWSNGASFCRSAARFGESLGAQGMFIGFRVLAVR